MNTQGVLLKYIGRIIGAAFIILIIINASIPLAHAQSDDAVKILKSMTDFMQSQKTLSISVDTDIEVITSQLEKIQFTSSGQVSLSRPDKLRVTRTGGYTELELVYDGKLLSVSNKDSNSFAQLDTAGSTDQLIDLLREKYAVAAPAADLLLSGAYDAMMSDVIESKHIGRGVVDGVECEHLAFRNSETDWQIWVQLGARPIPRKYVITSKAVTGAPQFTVRIKDFRNDLPADAFAFKATQGAKKVALEALENIDEVPAGTIGGKK